MNCNVCNQPITTTIKYDKHSFSLSSYIKRLLPYLDFLIPKSQIALKKYSFRKSPFKGQVLLCDSCGYGVLEHPPSFDELKAYYQADYWVQRTDDTDIFKDKGAEYKSDYRAVQQVELLTSVIGERRLNRILEIGAASAFASLYYKHEIDNQVVIDVCEPAEQWEGHYQRNGINRVATFFPFETQTKYDYIHTSHWLEHVRDLNDTITSLSNLLSANGFVFIEVPNTAHSYWQLPIIDTPHIHFFTMSSLEKVFVNHGFNCLHIEECGIPFDKGLAKAPKDYDDFAQHEKGLWIRAIFKKTKEISH